jgi:Type VI secretion system effector, Hcp
MRKRSAIAAVVVMALLVGAAVSSVALLRPGGAAAAQQSDLTLAIEGLTPPGAPIQVLSYSWGLVNGVGQNAKLQLQDLNFASSMDQLSPSIVQAVKSGKTFPSATLVVAPPNLQGFQYDLTGVRIVSDQQGGSFGGGQPTEQVSLHADTVDLHTIASP